MNITQKLLIMTAIHSGMYSSFSGGVNKLIRQYQKRKPDYYKVSLSKQERKGKTPEEIQKMRIAKYNRINGIIEVHDVSRN